MSVVLFFFVGAVGIVQTPHDAPRVEHMIQQSLLPGREKLLLWVVSGTMLVLAFTTIYPIAFTFATSLKSNARDSSDKASRCRSHPRSTST